MTVALAASTKGNGKKPVNVSGTWMGPGMGLKIKNVCVCYRADNVDWSHKEQPQAVIDKVTGAAGRHGAKLWRHQVISRNVKHRDDWEIDCWWLQRNLVMHRQWITNDNRGGRPGSYGIRKLIWLL